MATLNVYRFIPGKPMIHSLESAREFLASTKQPLRIKTARGYYEICNGSISLVENVNEWMDFECWLKIGDDAVRCIYQLRKIINARFKH